MKRTGSTNVMLRKLIDELKSQKNIWRAVAEELDVPSRKRAYVNLYKINKYTKSGDVVIVPGKVLGVGSLDHPVTVAALDFSKQARAKIEKSGGKVMSLYKALQEVKEFKNVRLMKG
ncbi:MAG: 50S ribosomal protein L18e [Candidatus Aramenus sulfurataquae]|jgi:large subunit ribosomal protein L18e|uniref:Large ribosomal subunit protein eL18 n=2 Tax=Candidatus Aramenus sulfurataquae TaxID=1326980 RepID=W7KPY2_9CREN|nr:MAG: 50S ribosomal protein L18e [Candidatus Aramenus sulfurataquae]MCL7343019.1 50S ribosomal protein L18e [Candidatus Aramenus sulfurataquae]